MSSVTNGHAIIPSNNDTQIIKLAEKHFTTLTSAELNLLTAVQKGTVADYCVGDKAVDDVNNASKWDENRVIKADVISWLCSNKKAQPLISNNGIRINGARIEGKLDLSYCNIPFPLVFTNSVFSNKFKIVNAEIFLLHLSGSVVRTIQANGLIVKKNIAFNNGFKAIKEVFLLDARVGTGINCQNAKFINKGGITLAADRIYVNGLVNLNDGFISKGEVRFSGATITGDLNCSNGSFLNPKGIALNLQGIKINNTLFMSNGFYAKGSIWLKNAVIGKNLQCTNAKIINKKGYTLMGNNCIVGGSIQLRDGFISEGEMQLQFARIDGNLEAVNCSFLNKGGFSLFAEGIIVSKNIYLRDGFVSEGKVDISSSRIGNNLYCDGGKFINENGFAIAAGNINVDGGIFMRDGFLAKGEVELVIAYCKQLECQGSSFINPGKKALNCYRITVENSVALSDGFKANGLVNMFGAHIRGVFQWKKIVDPKLAKLSLEDAVIGTIWDDKDSWPEKGNLSLQGFVYSNIHKKSPRDLDDRLEWIHRQGNKFLAQPYEQLAKVFKSIGYDKSATKILYEKNMDKAKFGNLKGLGKVGHNFLGYTIGFGYKPMRALIWMIFIVLFGAFIFKYGNNNQLIVPIGKSIINTSNSINTKEKLPNNYPVFSSFIYSIDVFIPIIDLQMQKYWHTNSAAVSEIKIFRNNKILIRGGYIRCYFIIHILIGWVLTTLLLAGISGIIRI